MKPHLLPAVSRALTAVRRWLRCAWLGRPSLADWLRGWDQQRSRRPRPTVRLEIEQCEQRMTMDDILGVVQVPLVISGVALIEGSLLTPLGVMARGWSGGRAAAPPVAPVAGTARTGLGDRLSDAQLAALASAWAAPTSPQAGGATAVQPAGPNAGVQPVRFGGPPQSGQDYFRNPLGDDWLNAVGAAVDPARRYAGAAGNRNSSQGGGPVNIVAPSPGVNASSGLPGGGTQGSSGGTGYVIPASATAPAPAPGTAAGAASPSAPTAAPLALAAAPATTTAPTTSTAAAPSTSAAPASAVSTSAAGMAALYQGGGVPLAFEPNQGQTDSRVNFLSHGPGFELFLTGNAAVFSFARPGQTSTRDVVQMQLAGANAAPTIDGAHQLTSRSNYFTGTDPSKWVANVPNYGEVDYANIYPGIDLRYHAASGRQLEYDFVVHPGASPSAIQLLILAQEKTSYSQRKGTLACRMKETSN